MLDIRSFHQMSFKEMSLERILCGTTPLCYTLMTQVHTYIKRAANYRFLDSAKTANIFNAESNFKRIELFMLVLGFAIDRQIAFLLGFNLEKQYLMIFYLEASKHLKLSQEIFVDVHKLILSHAIGLCL